MSYKITPYTLKRAKELGVEVKPSKLKNKKIDIYKNGTKLASVGDIRYNDFGTYLQMGNVSLANEKRSAYHKRHSKDNVKGTRGWWALNLLW